MNYSAFVGSVYKKPELRKTPSGISVAKFFIKVDKQKGYTLVPIVVWAELAEREVPHLEQGTMVITYGSYDTGSYEKDGEKVYTHGFKARYLYRLFGSEYSVDNDVII